MKKYKIDYDKIRKNIYEYRKYFFSNTETNS